MISKKFSFSWPEIIKQASMKDMWVNELEVSRRIGEFPENKLATIKWERRGGAFFIPNLSAYTTLSTLFDWLWMWAASAARQCVCDLGGGHFTRSYNTFGF